MKKVILAVILALLTVVFTGTTVLAVDLGLPNGKVLEGLPDEAANAVNSGVIKDVTPPPCVPPCRT